MTLTLVGAGAALVGTGMAIDTVWLLGIGVWSVMAGIAIELIYRP